MKEKTTPKEYKNILYKIIRIRMIEEEIAKQYPQGKMRCPTHLSIGQEAVPVMLSEQFTKDDLAVSTHRGHAHFLAKGGDLKKFIAELHGKETGSTCGRGGSMNLSDLQAGFVASTAIVGNTVPIGVGLSFAQQLRKENNVTCIYLGDAAVEEGVVYESLNFSALRNLPVIFVCENNLYSMNTHLELRQPKNREIFKMAEAIGAKTKKLDGNDVIQSFDAVKEVIHDLRQNSGVWFLEFETYRYKVHCGPENDPKTDRAESELNYWFKKDPVFLLQNYLLEKQEVTESEVQNWHEAITQEIEEAFDFALQSSLPNEAERYTHKYAPSPEKWLADKLNNLKEGAQVA